MGESPLRVLIATYAFPPVGGAGVQRIAKLTKYLPAFGVTPTILTVSNPSVPVMDGSMVGDVPEGTRVLRTRTFEPGYGVKQAAWRSEASAGSRPGLRARATQRLTRLAKQLLVPDPQILWQPTAQGALLRRLLGREPDEVVFVSGPPFSQFLLAPLCRLRPGVAVVLDYRDEWSTYRTTYEMTGGRAAAAIAGGLERAILRTAHAVTTATDEFRDNLLARFPFLSPARVHAIPNGYDPDDFPADLPRPPADRFVMTYAGTAFKLTSPAGLLGAIRRLHAAEPALAALLAVRFCGRIVDTELSAFQGTEALGVQRLGYLGHREVLCRLAASHLALCILDDVPGVERIYPGKIFELMYLGRPCLVLTPPGALSRLVERHHLGPLFHPRDEAGIAAFLEARLRAFQAGRPEPPMAPVDIARYHRRSLAGEFATVMRAARDAAR